MIRNIFLGMVVFFVSQPFLFSQGNDTISEKEAGRIIRYLASDSLKGRGNISPELLTASLFIGNEFKKSKLLPLPGLPNCYIPFHPYGGEGAVFIMDQLLWNGTKSDPNTFMYLHQLAGNYPDKTLADFTVMKFDSFFTENTLDKFLQDSSSLLLWTDKKRPDDKVFPKEINMPSTGLHRDVLLVYADKAPSMLSLTGFPSQYLTTEYNIVGVLPGRSKPNEVIVFSAHYDHVGVGGGEGDMIFNGANDNASGTTALLLLAEYFSKRNDNERTIMFCAFSGEEQGLLGSTDFTSNINPEKIIAGINLEMIGVPQYGKNKVFIVGEKYSDLPRVLSAGLKRNGIIVTSEPAASKNLFQRSDNYPFAFKGIPFHTIMASDDYETCYHQPCDEVRRIDIANMARITRGIAVSAAPLINGEVTPRRINPRDVELKKQ